MGLQAEGINLGLALQKPPVGQIPKFKFPAFPNFVFEYHGADTSDGKVYLIDLASKPTDDGKYIAEIIAEHVDTYARAFGFVQTFLRGFRRGRDGVIVAPVK